MAHFAIENLTFTYAGATEPALREVSLRVKHGSYLCLCGRTGSGKSTLLRMMKTALTPAGIRTGQVMFKDAPLEAVDRRDQAAMIGYIAQDPEAQIVTDSVQHELSFGLESLGVDRSAMHLRVAEMASFFGIQGWISKEISELSGGQKQLLNLASVMALHPGALLLDEPTAQLDPIAASEFLDAVRRINRELGTTVIISEHRLEEVFPVADAVAVLDQGRLKGVGSPRTVASDLYASQDPMALALPTPIRVFHRLEGDGPVPEDKSDRSPLTVREGRYWLTERVLADPPAVVALPEEADAKKADAKPGEEPPLALELRELWFRFERQSEDILRGATLQVPMGSISALVGGNGTGKSTLLRCAQGLLRPYRGSVRVFGKKRDGFRSASRPSSHSDNHRDGTMVSALLPQEPKGLFSRTSVRAELQEMLEGRDPSTEEGARRLEDVAQLCGIEELLDRHPLDLSGGQRQQAALAKVLLTEARLLLLDEPTKGLDWAFKRQLGNILADLQARGITILLVSHDLEFCARYTDRVSLLFDGTVVTTATPRRFFSENSFYTTAANRMSRNVFANAITDEDIVALCSAGEGMRNRGY